MIDHNQYKSCTFIFVESGMCVLHNDDDGYYGDGDYDDDVDDFSDYDD